MRVIVGVNNWCVCVCYGNSRLASFSFHISDCLVYLWFIYMSIETACAHLCMWEGRRGGEREGRRKEECISVFDSFRFSDSFCILFPQRLILDSVHLGVCSRLQIVWLSECDCSVFTCVYVCEHASCCLLYMMFQCLFAVLTREDLSKSRGCVEYRKYTHTHTCLSNRSSPSHSTATSFWNT